MASATRGKHEERRPPISYQRVRDVLDQVRDYHQQLRLHYEQSAFAADDERVEWLLARLAWHERVLEQSLAEGGADEAVLDTYLQFVPELELPLEETRLGPDASFEEIVEKATCWDRAVIDFYRQMSGSTAAPRVQELFESLLEREEARAEDTSWRALQDRQHEMLERDAGGEVAS